MLSRKPSPAKAGLLVLTNTLEIFILLNQFRGGIIPNPQETCMKDAYSFPANIPGVGQKVICTVEQRGCKTLDTIETVVVGRRWDSYAQQVICALPTDEIELIFVSCATRRLKEGWYLWDRHGRLMLRVSGIENIS